MKLTGRRVEVANLISQGYSEKMIACTLGISPDTVHSHARTIRQQLGAPNIAGITRAVLVDKFNKKIRFAFRCGLITGMYKCATHNS